MVRSRRESAALTLEDVAAGGILTNSHQPPRKLAVDTLQGYGIGMRNKAKTAAARRIARIAGQVSGIGRMVEEDRYCIDIVRQVQAAKAALTGLEKVILDDHLDTCVETALAGEDLDARRDKVEELVAVLGGRRK